MSDVLIRLADGSVVSKPWEQLSDDDRVVVDGPEAFKGVDRVQRELDDEIAAAGGVDAWRAASVFDQERR